jgi:hypothetical protein
LKLTGESEKAPVSSAVTLVEVSRFFAMFTLLQGSTMEGRRASPLMGVSLRSRAGRSGGAVAAWALVEDVKIRRTVRAVKDLESISRNNKEWMKARRIAALSAKDTGTEEPVLLECEQSVKIVLGMNAEIIEINYDRWSL